MPYSVANVSNFPQSLVMYHTVSVYNETKQDFCNFVKDCTQQIAYLQSDIMHGENIFIIFLNKKCKLFHFSL